MGKRIAAKITGVGGYVPPQVLTNADIAKLVDTDDQWIRERTGISERHIVEPGVATSHLATAAAQTVLEKTHTASEEIDLIIVATVTPDMLFPATACLVQNRIGASRAWGFDLSAACSGFVYALTVGAQFVGAGTQKKALVIGSDVMTSVLNYQDRATCVLFGDGAGAVLLEPTDRDDEGILDFVHDVDGSGGKYLYMPGGGSLHPASAETVEKKMHYIHQEGAQVFKYAVRRMAELACEMLERNGFTSKDLALVVPHQVSMSVIERLTSVMEYPIDRCMVTLDRFGNTAAASIPFALDLAIEEGRARVGDKVLLVGGAAGFSAAVVPLIL